MKARRFSGIVTLMTLIAMINACDPDAESTPISPEGTWGYADQQEPTAGAHLRSNARSSDEVQAEWLAEVPGYAGWWVDDGMIVVALTSAAKGDAEERIRNLIPVEGLPTVRRNAKYDFAELLRWQGLLDLGLKGDWISVDIDEVQNRLELRVRTLAGVGEHQERARTAGIPDDALLVELADPITPLSTLRDAFNQIPGGAKITDEADYGYSGTLGVNVKVDGFRGFALTAGHVAGGPFSVPLGFHSVWQPTIGGSSKELKEVRDDAPYYIPSTGCTGSCRWSEMSILEYQNPNHAGDGKIARTSYVNNYGTDSDGSVDVVGSWSIRRARMAPSVFLWTGAHVEAVGQTSGWVHGPVTQTCTNFNYLGVVVLCQDLLAGYMNSGDSGSPVFSAGSGAGHPSTTVDFEGIVWARLTNGHTVFSSWGNILAEYSGICVTGPPGC